jgi:histidinol phosphatase-like enzyme (inositol monophosphatase family)
MPDLDYFKNFSRYLASESGKIISSYFRTKINVDEKSDLSPVTIADKKAEERIRELIMKELPSHGIVGEEFGIINPEAEYQWVIDPIDGTKSFICGAFSFGTLIGLTKNNLPILGVIHQPVLKELLIGDNQVSEFNGEKVKVRGCSSLTDAVLLTTDYLNVEKYRDLNSFDKLIRSVKIYRQWGDCYGYFLLSLGYADIMIDPIMSTWDTTALIPIIKGAGGIISDYYGNDPLKGNSAVAANPSLHAEIIKLLNN